MKIFILSCLLTLFSIFCVQFSFAQWTTNGNNIYNSNTANVGIGTSNPTYKLDVAAPARIKGSLNFAGATGYPAGESWINFHPNSGDPYSQYFYGLNFNQSSGNFALNSSHNLRLYYLQSFSLSSKVYSGGSYTYTQRMAVNNAGNVAIGTQTPKAALDVGGNIIAGGYNSAYTEIGTDVSNNPYILGHASPLLIGSGSNYTMLVSATNVGVGTLAPNSNAKLDVNGNIFSSGKIIVGTTDIGQYGSYAMAVNGNAIFNKIKVKQYGNWADYVFEEDYPLMPLESVEQFILKYKHLPYLQSAAIIEKEGQDIGEIQASVVRTIEELTLHTIALNKRIEEQQIQIETQQKLLTEMTIKLEKLLDRVP